MENVPTKDKLYLGCGKDIQPDFINLDMFPFPGVDFVWKCPDRIPFPDSSFSLVKTQDFLEHIHPEDKIPLMNEIWRVLTPGGKMEHIIPLAGTRNDFGSPSHLSHWHPQQFEHFDVDSYRYKADHEYEGFVGGFHKVFMEYSSEPSGETPQSFKVIYTAVK
jgi:predicted SAM-dependent methyltransferase